LVVLTAMVEEKEIRVVAFSKTARKTTRITCHTCGTFVCADFSAAFCKSCTLKKKLVSCIEDYFHIATQVEQEYQRFVQLQYCFGNLPLIRDSITSCDVIYF
jgi:hypothetical protein